MVQKLCYASKSVTDGRTDGWMDGRTHAQTSQKQYAPPTSSKLGGGGGGRGGHKNKKKKSKEHNSADIW